MPRPRPIQVRGTTVQIPIGVEGSTGLEVTPDILHTSKSQFGGFADRSSLYDAAPVKHRFDLVITRDMVDMEAGLRSAARPDWDTIAGLCTPYPAEARGEAVLAAYLVVDELPARFRRELNTTWAEWLDSMDGELGIVGEFADELADRPDTKALQEGSLFYLREVDVHPLFAGQCVGARLIAHAMWTVCRSAGDVAALLARPKRGRFREFEPEGRHISRQGLVKYYERIGFARAEPGGPGSDDCELMFALIGARPLNFAGIGALGADDCW
jgi:GNAT superfamily N-acetyltransferase